MILHKEDYIYRYERCKEAAQLLNPQARIVVVTKYSSFETIKQLYLHGIRDFGENRAQDLEVKAQLAHESGMDEIRWHFIGRIQSNKMRKIVRLSHYIHSIDSLLRLEQLNILASEFQRMSSFFLQVKPCIDPSKQGLSVQDAAKFLESDFLLRYPWTKFEGLMTMTALGAQKEEQIRNFLTLSVLKANAHKSGLKLALSMGMSDDCGLALFCGADWLRLGRILFVEDAARREA